MALNPKNGQGDGAGFGRLRAAQQMRTEFLDICARTHPSCTLYIDKVHEYAGVQIVFYRSVHNGGGFEHARVAVFSGKPGAWRKESDMIAAQA